MAASNRAKHEGMNEFLRRAPHPFRPPLAKGWEIQNTIHSKLETRNSKLSLHSLNFYRVQHHIFVGLVLAVARKLGDFVHHVLALDDFAKDRVITG
jgi:hypothetical protein